jgi:hypothetical protein
MISFTIAQINELLQALGNIPYVYSKPLIDGINQIAQQQMAENVAQKQQNAENVAQKQQNDVVVEPDTSLS